MSMLHFFVIISYVFLISIGTNISVYAEDTLDNDFSSMKIQFEDVLRESLTTKVIRFRVQTCMLSASPSWKTFQVSIRNMKTQRDKILNVRTTGPNSPNKCLTFFHQVSFEPLKTERLFFFNVEIKDMSLNQIVFSGAISINPWDEGWTSGRDITYLSESIIVSKEFRGELELSSKFDYQVSYESIRFRYEYQQDISIPIRGAQLVRIHLKPSNISSSTNRRRLLRDGIYLMKASLFEREAVELKELKVDEGKELSSARRLVRVIDGRSSMIVDFPREDIRNVYTDPAVVRIQLEPLEEWRYHMVRLYNDFYERQINAVMKRERESGLKILELSMLQDLSREKIQNIHKIIQLMSQNKEMIHQLIERKYEQERENKKTYLVNGRQISSCHGLPEVHWDDIFQEFNLTHFALADLVGSDLSEKDRVLTAISRSSDLSSHFNERKARGFSELRYCHKPYNVVTPLFFNDISSVALEPIPGISLDEFVEAPESSGVEKEELTFFGYSLDP